GWVENQLHAQRAGMERSDIPCPGRPQLNADHLWNACRYAPRCPLRGCASRGSKLYGPSSL
ncbi:hypothetical protein, partial [Vibrio cidicii]|uniref:hypothetical protein n=1 Tax=Vibrio cidicii TaxID=1763883 RepID=UPI0037037B79